MKRRLHLGSTPQSPIRSSIVGALLLILVLTAAACGDGSGSEGESPAQGEDVESPAQGETVQTMTEFRIVIPTSSVLLLPELYSAISQGFFEDEGLRIETSITPGSEGVVQTLLAGRGDIANTTAETMFVLAAQGVKPKIVASALPQSIFGVFAPSDESIKSPSDLRGMTIGMREEGGIHESVLHAVAATGGLTPEDYEVLAVGDVGAAPPAFQRGDIDAWSGEVFEVSVLRSRGLEMGSITPDDFAQRSGSVYWVPEEVYERDRDALRGFARGLQRGYEWATANPDDWLEAAGELNAEETAEEDVAVELRDLMLSLVGPAEAGKPFGYLPLPLLEKWHQTALDSGRLEEPVPNLEELLANDYLYGLE